MLRPVADLQLESPKLDLTLCSWGICYGLLFLGFGASWAVIGPSLGELIDHTNSSLECWSWVLLLRALGYLLGAVIGERFFVRYPCSAIVIVAVVCECTCLVMLPMIRHLWPMAGIFMALGLAFGLMDTVGHSQLLSIQGDQALDRGAFPEKLSDFHDASFSLGTKVLPYIQTLHVAFGIGAVVISLLSVPYASHAHSAQAQSANLWANMNNNTHPSLGTPHTDNQTLMLVSNSLRPGNHSPWHVGLTDQEMNQLVILHIKHTIADMKRNRKRNRRSMSNQTISSSSSLTQMENRSKLVEGVINGFDFQNSAMINAMILGQEANQNVSTVNTTHRALTETNVSNQTSKVSSTNSTNQTGRPFNEDIADFDSIGEPGTENSSTPTTSPVQPDTIPQVQLTMANTSVDHVPSKNVTFPGEVTAILSRSHKKKSHADYDELVSRINSLSADSVVEVLEARQRDLFLPHLDLSTAKQFRLHWIFWSIVIIQIPVFFGFIILSLCSRNSPRHDLVLLSSAECHNAEENCMELHQEENSASGNSCQRGSIVVLLNIFHFFYSGIETLFPVLLCTYCTHSSAKVDSQAAVYITAVYWMFYTLGKIGVAPLLSICGHNLILAMNFPILLLGLVLLVTMSWSETVLWCSASSTGFCLSIIFPTLHLMVTSNHQLSRMECRSLLIGGGLGDMIIPATVIQFTARFNIFILGLVLSITSVVLVLLYICIYCLEVSARNSGTIRVLGLGHDVLFTTRGLLHIDSLHISQQKSSTLVAYRRVDSDESDDECQIIVNTAGVPVQINSSVQLSGVYETD